MTASFPKDADGVPSKRDYFLLYTHVNIPLIQSDPLIVCLNTAVMEYFVGCRIKLPHTGLGRMAHCRTTITVYISVTST